MIRLLFVLLAPSLLLASCVSKKTAECSMCSDGSKDAACCTKDKAAACCLPAATPAAAKTKR